MEWKHQSQRPGWDLYQLSMKFSAKNGQPGERENQSRTTINRLLRRNYYDKVHGDRSVRYSLYDNPLFAATV